MPVNDGTASNLRMCANTRSGRSSRLARGRDLREAHNHPMPCCQVQLRAWYWETIYPVPRDETAGAEELVTNW